MSTQALPAPEKFGRYEVQGVVGEGSMGRVYRAFDPLAQRVVAIKTLKSEYLTSDTGPEYLKRFRREAQAAGALSHPHIVTIFDVGEDFFVMELLEGTTLQGVLRERGRLELAEALKILAPVADALDYAHSRGTIHRDIKPGNIAVLADGRPKIMDFGVAHLTSTVMTAAGQFLGSPSYMAPEQIMKSEASPQTDLFSLAVVSYEMLTGRKPFEGESITTIIYKVVNELPPPPRKWNVELPPRFDDIFARALDKDPQRRYPNALSFTAALEMKEIDAGLTVSPPLPPPPELSVEPVATHEVATHDFSAEDAARTIVADPNTLSPIKLTRSGSRPWVLGIGAVVLAGAGLFYARGNPIAAPPTRAVPPILHIQTEPPGAVIFLDGVEVGHSPFADGSTHPGLHTVKVERAGFASAQLGFELVAGVTLAPLRFVLQPTSATLRLRSEPNGAAVLLDGKPIGSAPLEGGFVDPGVHELRVEAKGYRPWARKIEAKIGESIDLEARLDPLTRKAGAEPKPVPSTLWLKEGDLVELGPDVKEPRKISGDPAAYPAAAARLRLEGSVAIDMIVTETGEPTDLRVVESAGEILDRAVIDAVRRWRYEPAEKNGIKVRVHWRTRQRFERAR
jgi:serine/threonine-protein kinase